MLVMLVGFAFVFGLLLSRLGLAPMVGFLVAGFAFNFAGFSAPEGLAKIADLGITLLLFSIGLKLDLRGLAKPEIWGVSVLHLAFSTPLFACVLWLGQVWIESPLLQLKPLAILMLALALSFSSTVFAVKVLEERGAMGVLYGRVAIGILVMQDIAAVLLLAISEQRYPNLWAPLVLLLPLLRPLLYKILDAAGHGELLILAGLLLALALGYEAFSWVGLKGDLGALVMGVLMARHPKSTELSKALLSFKDLMLVGFFLSIGLQGLPSGEIVVAAMLLCLLLPIKALLYHVLLVRSGLRARTSIFSSLALGTYSEFGLILAALGVAQGWLSIDWLLVFAIAVSLSFALSAPLNKGAEGLYQGFKPLWDRFQRGVLHPDDRQIDIGEARALVIGMGRVGLGAYESLHDVFEGQIVGIDHDAKRVLTHRTAGRSALLGDATDTDFWTKLKPSQRLELIVLAMPAHQSNLYAARRIRKARISCAVAAIAHFPQEVEDLAALGVPAFNMYQEAGNGLARHALDSLSTIRSSD